MRQSLSITCLCLLVLAASLTGCWRKSGIPLDKDAGATDSDSDGDTDVDSDTDSDSDSDTDSDSDSDSDGDTDTYPNPDTAPDGYGEVSSVCWVTAFGGFVTDLLAYPDGSSVVVGFYRENAIFGAGEPEETTLPLTDGWPDEGYIARFDADGLLVWAKRVGATTFSCDGGPINALGATPDGGFAVAGHFWETATFGEGEPNETTLTAEAPIGGDFFLARYDADGSLVWVRQDGGFGDVTTKALAVLDDESYAVGGGFSGTIVFGEGEEHETTIESEAMNWTFVARFYDDGTLAWIDAFDGHELGRPIAVGLDGLFAVTGHYNEPVTLGEDDPGETLLPEPKGIYLSAYDYGGTVHWVGYATGNDDFLSESAATLTDGSYVIAGRCNGTVDYHDDLNPVQLTAEGGEYEDEACLARYSPEGLLIWAKNTQSYNGYLRDWMGAAPLPGEHFMILGAFEGAVAFGEGDLAETVLVASGEQEPFAAIYDDDGDLEWVARIGNSWEFGAAANVAALDDNTALVAGTFTGSGEFLAGEDEYVEIESPSEYGGFLLHLCPQLD